ncbi:3237_t:CDS:2, partial [Dentiscutata heterogama]
MKLYGLYYNFITLYLFLINLIIITKSQSFFNYTERNLNETFSQNGSPLIADIKTYDDGTILVHIVRFDSTQTIDCSRFHGMSLEQQIHIRIIHLNGTVKEIEPDLKLHPINYCLFNNAKYKFNKFNNVVVYLKDTNYQKNNARIFRDIINPITIYPLQKQFILVTYIKTTNSSYLTSFDEWGEIIDWNGKSRSSIRLGIWDNSAIQLNVNQKLGFLRFANVNSHLIGLKQYSVDNFGNLTQLINDSIRSYTFPFFPIAKMPTGDNGYAIVVTFTVESNSVNSFIQNGELYLIFIPYNKAANNNGPKLFYKITQPNIINSAYCNIDPFAEGIYCTVSDNSSHYTRIRLSSSKISGLPTFTAISDLPNITGLFQQGWETKAMPFGGYILDVTAHDDNDNNTYHYIYAYDDFNTLITSNSSGPYLTNFLGANAIIRNNTFLLASPHTNENSWSLLTIQLPKVRQDNGYDNVLIKKTVPSINATVNSSTTALSITFKDRLVLSTGNITIYKASDNSIRQRVSGKMQDFCKIDPDGFTVN